MLGIPKCSAVCDKPPAGLMGVPPIGMIREMECGEGLERRFDLQMESNDENKQNG